jgi:phosphopantothenoylcysteine decarboxylase/phosphopantothenate--cysteine ligase
MGYALARAAVARKDGVALVSGPVALPAPDGCERVMVRSAREMYDEALARFPSVDIVVMAAAVADFRPKARSATKIKKDGAGLVLELERTDDILAELGRRKAAQVLVGFALETPAAGSEASGITPDMREHARAKLESKSLDAIMLNSAGAMGSDTSAVAVLAATGEWHDWPEAAKDEHARRIVELAAGIVLAR